MTRSSPFGERLTFLSPVLTSFSLVDFLHCLVVVTAQLVNDFNPVQPECHQQPASGELDCPTQRGSDGDRARCIGGKSHS